MVHIEETIIPENGKVCYALYESFDTGMRAYRWMKGNQTIRLNFVNIIDFYDYEQCEEQKSEDYSDSNKYEHRFNYYVYLAEHKYVEELFLHMSDNFGGHFSLSFKEKPLHLCIDGCDYELPCFFATGEKGHYRSISNLYFRITPEILKTLASSSSIQFTYSWSHNLKNVDISQFKEYALTYYEKVYIENYGNPEEKEYLRVKREAEEKRKEEAEKKQQEIENKRQEAEGIRKEEERKRKNQENQEFWKEHPLLEQYGITKIFFKKIIIWGAAIIVFLLFLFS